MTDRSSYLLFSCVGHLWNSSFHQRLTIFWNIVTVNLYPQHFDFFFNWCPAYPAYLIVRVQIRWGWFLFVCCFVTFNIHTRSTIYKQIKHSKSVYIYPQMYHFCKDSRFHLVKFPINLNRLFFIFSYGNVLMQFLG